MVTFVLLFLSTFEVQSDECHFEPWQFYKQDRLLRNPAKTAVLFQTEHRERTN